MGARRTLLSFLRSVPVYSKATVKWGEMDAFQHVNNVAYFRYIECARIKYFDALLAATKAEAKAKAEADAKGEEEPPFDYDGFMSPGGGLGPILGSTSCHVLW